MKHLIFFCCLFFAFQSEAQTYSRDGLGIKFIQLEGCKQTSNGNPCDSCFVITNGVNGKLNRCLHISQLRSLLLGGSGSADSTYLVDNEDGTYWLFNENGMEYIFGYSLDVNSDTLFLLDHDGHIADYILAADLDNQNLTWDAPSKQLGITNGNVVTLTGLGVDSVKLSLSGNIITSKVNTLTDTSLAIGQNEIILSGDVLYSTVNGVIDTAELGDLLGLSKNGIYGGSDTIPDSTLAFLPTDHSFAIGSFPSWPSTNNSDLGIIWNGPYTGNQGLYFFGQQKPFPLERHGFGKVTCDEVSWKIEDGSIPSESSLVIGDESWVLSESNNTAFNSSSISGVNGVGMWTSTYYNLINADSITIFVPTQLALDIAGSRGVDGQVLTAQGGYAIWADPCCDTIGGGTGGGVDSISLGITGNIMTMGVNALTDTSLIIGELNTNLSGNIITTEVNNVTDTTLAVGNVTSSLSGSVLTTSVNGVSDTAQLSGLLTGFTTNVLSYSNPILTSTVNGITDTALVSISGVSDVDLDLSGNVMTSNVDGVSDTTLVIGELNTNLSGNIITTEINNVTDTTLVIGSNILSWNPTDKILTLSINGVSDTSFVTGLNGIYSGSGNVPNQTYSEVLTSEEFAIGYFTDFGSSITPVIDRGVYLKTNGTYIVGGDSTNQVRNSGEFLTDGIQIWSDSVSMESRVIVNKDSLVNRVVYTANYEGGRIGMWGDSMKLQQDYNNLIIQGPSITLNDHGGTGRGTSGQVWHSNGTSGYWDDISSGASSNILSLSGNTMTSNVDGVIDTSLVIGSNIISWDSTNKILTSTINGIYDTTKITVASGSVSSNTLTWNGANTLTSNVNGISDTSFIYNIDSINLIKRLKLGATFAIEDFNGSVGNSNDILLNNGTGNPYWIDRHYKSVNTLSQITSDQDNYTSSSDVINISGDNGLRAITSLSTTGIVSGQIVTYNNVGTYPIYFPANHPDASTNSEIEYKEDIILMPNNSIQFQWQDNSGDDYWRPLVIPPVNGYNVYEFTAIPGSITAGDHGNIAFATNGGTSGTQGPISGTPLAAFSSATSTGATNSATVVLLKTVEEFCYTSENHIIGEWLVSIPTLSDATDSFDIYCHFLQNPSATTANPNNNFGFRYSHGANGGEWYGFSKDNGGTTSTVDLNRSVTAGVIYNLRLEMDKSKTEIRFYVDGNYAGRITSNLPASAAYTMRSAIFKGVGTSSRSLNTHRMHFKVITP